MLEVTIGTDPEVFLRLPSGAFVSAHDRIPGEKYNPYPVPHGAIQVDGVAAEFNTNPAKTEDEFVSFIESVLSSVRAYAGSDVEIAIEPTAWFDREYFDSLPDTPKLLGCTPDYDAYTEAKSSPPGTDEPFRTGAGHIHVGFAEAYDPTESGHFSVCARLVRQLDCILYPTSLLWDYDQKRRELYGRIGSFRPKFYGVEYRSLSNAYLREKAIQRWVFRATKTASESLLNSGVDYTGFEPAKALTTALYAGEVPSKTEIRQYLRALNSEFGTPLFL